MYISICYHLYYRYYIYIIYLFPYFSLTLIIWYITEWMYLIDAALINPCTLSSIRRYLQHARCHSLWIWEGYTWGIQTMLTPKIWDTYHNRVILFSVCDRLWHITCLQHLFVYAYHYSVSSAAFLNSYMMFKQALYPVFYYQLEGINLSLLDQM